MIKWSMMMALAALLTVSVVPAFADEAGLQHKLDKVLANQDEILRQLGEIKTEVQITKIRASNN